MTATPLQHFDSGATRSPSKTRYDLIPPSALRELARRYGVGAELHGEDNWLKGIPFSAMIYHLAEHLEKFKEGRVEERGDVFGSDGDIENLAAIMWGAAGLIEYISRGRVDLDDRKYKTPIRLLACSRDAIRRAQDSPQSALVADELARLQRERAMESKPPATLKPFPVAPPPDYEPSDPRYRAPWTGVSGFADAPSPAKGDPVSAVDEDGFVIGLSVGAGLAMG